MQGVTSETLTQFLLWSLLSGWGVYGTQPIWVRQVHWVHRIFVNPMDGVLSFSQ